jgi:hypothetical protein
VKDFAYSGSTPPIITCVILEIAISLAKEHASGHLELDDEALELAMDASWDAIKR